MRTVFDRKLDLFMNFDMESVAYQRIKFAAKIPSTSKSMVKTFT